MRRSASRSPSSGDGSSARIVKLGIDVSERTVSRYMARPAPEPDQLERWKAFLRNHDEGIAAVDVPPLRHPGAPVLEDFLSVVFTVATIPAY